jgi:hypothetical protein
MMAACPEPISESTLLDYWTADLADGAEMNVVEEHLFACAACSARLSQLVALGAGVTRLAKQGRLSGVVSRAILNRLQRDGVHVRMFSIEPGETVPCATFPGDDLIVTSLWADFSGVDAVTLSVTGPDSAAFSRCDDVPVPRGIRELLWVTPAALVREMPSMRLELTLTSTGGAAREIGRYLLEHSASVP